MDILEPGPRRPHRDFLHLGLHHLLRHAPSALHLNWAIYFLKHLLDRRLDGLLPPLHPPMVRRSVGYGAFQVRATDGDWPLAAGHLHDECVQGILAVCAGARFLHRVGEWVFVCSDDLGYIDVL